MGFLVQAENDGLVRWVHVKPHYVDQFLFKTLVVGQLERLHPVGLDAPLPPDPRDRRERDPELGGQEPGRPVRDPEALRRPPVIGQRRDHDVGLVDPRRAARAGLVVQRGDAALEIAVPPADHRRARHPGRPGDLRVRDPVGGQQHDPGPLRQPRRHIGSRASSASRSRSPGRRG